MATPRIDLPGEIWKPVLGYEDSYEVSNLGRVWSVPIGNGEWGTGRILAAAPDRKGYPRVSLKGKTYKVHHLVLNAFRGPRPEGHECAHSDGDSTNPHLVNLRWATPVANAADRVSHGTKATGANHGSAILTEDDVRTIRHRRTAGHAWKVIAADYPVAKNTVISAGIGITHAEFEPETICQRTAHSSHRGGNRWRPPPSI